MFRKLSALTLAALAVSTVALGATASDIQTAIAKLGAAATASAQGNSAVALANVTAAQAKLVPATDFPKTRAELTAALAALGKKDTATAGTRIANATKILKALKGTSEAPASTGAVSFKTSVKPILNARCIACHPGFGSAASLVNVASGEAKTLALVKPGSSAQSYLFHKVKGTQASVGGGGSTMPKGGSPLTAAQIATIKSWIDAGAPNN
jgi:hypothetical protein